MKRIFIAATCFTTIALLLIILLVWPLVRDIKKSSDDLLVIRQTISSLGASIEDLEQFKTTYKRLNDDLAKARALFVNRDMPVDFIEFLEGAADDSQLAIAISPASVREVKGDIWPSMNFKLSLSGSATSCFKFLEKLETSPFLLDIQNFSITKTEQEEAQSNSQEGLPPGEVRADFLIKTYVQ